MWKIIPPERNARFPLPEKGNATEKSGIFFGAIIFFKKRKVTVNMTKKSISDLETSER